MTDPSLLAGTAELEAALGRYHLVAQIGRGGMADVFLALCRNEDGTNRPVVLKQLRSELAQNDDFRAMFANEARLATRFDHKNVIQTYDLYSDPDLCVLVMEFLDGQTLSRVRHRAENQVPFSVHLRVLAEVLAGLHYVHERTDDDARPLGIVHRDVTPSNIFVTYDGTVKVVDFGIACATTLRSETRRGVVKGNLAYMAPEVVRSESVDGRSDIFSVGVMLWEAATGRRLWQGHDEVALFDRLAKGDLPIHAPGAEGTSAEMLRIAERALAVDPLRRYATAEAMRQELESVMARLGHPTHAAALAGYMDAFFAGERGKFQAAIDDAVARFAPESAAESRVTNELSVSFPGIDATQFCTTISSMRPSAEMSRTTTTLRDVVQAMRALPQYRPGARRAIGVASLAAVVAMGVAYAAHVPSDAPARAAPMAVAVERTATPDEPHSTVNHPAATPSLTPEPPLVLPAPAAQARARGTISAVFLVRPPYARLFLDGAPLEGNPAGIRRQPDDKPHLLRVEAPGYATLVRVINLDSDVAKEFELAPEPTPGLAAPRTAPSPESHDEPPKAHPAKRTVARDDPWGI